MGNCWDEYAKVHSESTWAKSALGVVQCTLYMAAFPQGRIARLFARRCSPRIRRAVCVLLRARASCEVCQGLQTLTNTTGLCGQINQSSELLKTLEL